MNPAKLRSPIFWAFAAFTLIACLGTLWPGLKIPGPDRLDLKAHFGTFGLWTFLCGLVGFFGHWRSRENIATACVAGIVFSAAIEALQAVPFIRRTCAWDDMGANAIGVLLGTAALALAARSFTKQPAA
jgi:hypothetical protein